MSIDARRLDVFFNPLSRLSTTQLLQRLTRLHTYDADLHAIVQEADLKQLRQLLERPIDLNGVDEGGQTPLHLALRSGSPAIVRVLLEAGALPDPPPPPSLTDSVFVLFRLVKLFTYSWAFYIILRLGLGGLSAVNEYAVRVFLSNLAVMFLLSCLLLAVWSHDDNQLNSTTLKALLSTDATRYLNVKHHLEKSGELPYRRAWSWPLGAACGNRRIHAIKAFLDAGADPNLQTSSGLTALHITCDQYTSDNVESTVEMLLEHGADINAVTSDSWSAVGRLCNTGVSPEALQLLLRADAQVDYGAGKNTPLQIAARYDVSGGRLVEMLLQKGANPNAIGGKFGTALLAALHRSDNEEVVLKIVCDLISHGADTNAAPGGRDPPILKAAMRNWIAVAEKLLKEKAVIPPAQNVDIGDGNSTLRRNVPLLGYLSPYQPDMFRLLLSHGAPPNGDSILPGPDGGRGMTILGQACESSSEECFGTAQLLLESGADPNCIDGLGMTPVQYAASALSRNHMSLLLEYDAELSMQNGSLWHLLCKGAVKNLSYSTTAERFLQLCELVEGKLATDLVWIRDENGRNCLHYLAELGDETHLIHSMGTGLARGSSPAASLVSRFLGRYGMLASPEAILDEDLNGNTAFQIASRTGDVEMMETIMGHVFQINLERDVAVSAGSPRDLIVSVVETNSEFARKILSHVDQKGRTALHIAASEGRISACRFLLENPHVPGTLFLTNCNSGQSAAEYAESHGHQMVADYLLTFKGFDTTSADMKRRQAAFAGAHMKKVRMVLTKELVENVVNGRFEESGLD
ncbi:hypothetical protein TWF718_000002 [Orbilia javanica]|uniref:Uncharacterized protein n=1 Tax=Orbilia javanica TaxID=47235 RepID=A0AAN8N6Y4_9PEZI